MSHRRLGDTIKPQFSDLNGNPLAGGKLKFFENKTTTPKDVFADEALTVNLGPEIVLDGAGRAEVWLDGPYRLQVQNAAAVLQYELDDVNTEHVVTGQVGSAITNPSFEDPITGLTPDAWTLSTFGSGVAERRSDAADGKWSLAFESFGSGGGQALSSASPFAVVAPRVLVGFAHRSTNAALRNIVEVLWLDVNLGVIGSDTIYDSQANPTVWTWFQRWLDAPPASTRFAQVRLTGAEAGVGGSGSAFFDSIVVRLSHEGRQVIQEVLTVDGTHRAGLSGTVPNDNTIPQLDATELREYAELATTITPDNAAHLIEIDCELQVYQAFGAAGQAIAGLAKDAVASSVAVAAHHFAATAVPGQMRIRHREAAGGVVAQTWRVGAGRLGSAGTVQFNGLGAATFGGTLKSWMRVREVRA